MLFRSRGRGASAAPLRAEGGGGAAGGAGGEAAPAPGDLGAGGFRGKAPGDTRVVVFGATGYIGRFVVRELVARGYDVLAFSRGQAGVGGKLGKAEVEKQLPGARVAFGDVCDAGSLGETAFAEPADVVVSCLASRSGGKEDSWKIDYQATLNTLEAGKAAGAQHYVLLSAICVQKPLLEFQKAKLKLEAELAAAAAAGGPTFSIVRPTAFFKSLGGQVESVKNGGSYVMFGDGELASCKPISERDLAKFMADCISDPAKENQVLPVGGPGEALSAKQQAEVLFKLLGKEPKTFGVPLSLFDGIIGVLDFLAKYFPSLEDKAEFGRIGKYYASESMLVWDEGRQEYDAAATPSYGTDTLEGFFQDVIENGMAGQELGDAAVFGQK